MIAAVYATLAVSFVYLVAGLGVVGTILLIELPRRPRSAHDWFGVYCGWLVWPYALRLYVWYRRRTYVG